jgi:hypothetical protein
LQPFSSAKIMSDEAIIAFCPELREIVEAYANIKKETIVDVKKLAFLKQYSIMA